MSSDIQSLRGSPTVCKTRLKTLPRVSLDHPNPLGLHPINQQRTSARRISASFSTHGPPSCLPVVATSSMTASNTHGELPMIYATASRPTRKVTPTTIPLPKASTATTYQSATASCPQNNENVPPGAHFDVLQHKQKNSFDIAAARLRGKSGPRPLGTLPKSNTLNVITNLTASISRTSLSRFSQSASISSTADSEPATSMASGSSISAALPSAGTGNPREVHVARPSAYWSGRYMALQDRFRNEMLLPENMTALITAHAERSIIPEHKPRAAAHLPELASTPSLRHGKTKDQKSHRDSLAVAPEANLQLARGSLEAARLEDEENRARRVFRHLEALCTTSEARKSLHTWQQSYARRMGKERLLPSGGSMEDKGWVERLLRRSSHDAGRRASLVGVSFR